MRKFEKTFDQAMLDYEMSRPLYPKELYDDLFRYKEISASSQVLEIGIGTGKATKPIIERQCNLTALEPGENLAYFSKEKFREYGNFSVHNLTLQEYECPAESYDLVYAATAFHWIPEEYGYRRVYELLKKGGVFARFAYHAGTDKKRKMLADEIQEVYGRYMKRSKAPKEYGIEDAKALAEIALKYGFSSIDYRIYHWTKDFTADEYMALLRTYPDHMKLEASDRNKLFSGIHEAIERNGGVITVRYMMDMQLAVKK